MFRLTRSLVALTVGLATASPALAFHCKNRYYVPVVPVGVPVVASHSYSYSTVGFAAAPVGTFGASSSYALPQTYSAPATYSAVPTYAMPQTYSAVPNYAMPQTYSAVPNYAMPQTYSAPPNYAMPQAAYPQYGTPVHVGTGTHGTGTLPVPTPTPAADAALASLLGQILGPHLLQMLRCSHVLGGPLVPTTDQAALIKVIDARLDAKLAPVLEKLDKIIKNPKFQEEEAGVRLKEKELQRTLADVKALQTSGSVQHTKVEKEKPAKDVGPELKEKQLQRTLAEVKALQTSGSVQQTTATQKKASPESREVELRRSMAEIKAMQGKGRPATVHVATNDK